MRLRNGVFAVSIAAVGLMLQGGLATAQVDESKNWPAEEIQEFTNRVEGSWGISIDPADYEVRTDHDGVRFIVRVDAPAVVRGDTPAVVRATDSGQDEVIGEEISLGATSPPNAQEAQRQMEEGVVTIQQETVWYQPSCAARVEDGDGAGYMDACWQWGDMNYEGQTRSNWGFRMYGTCAPKDDAFFTELVECYVDTVRNPGSASLSWNDWSPKSTTNLGGCGNVSLSIGVGPVTASANVATCEELVPEKGAEAGDMRVRWVGDAYWDNDVRETGSLIGIGHAYGTTALLDLSFGYFYSGCNPPPNVIDQCG